MTPGALMGLLASAAAFDNTVQLPFPGKVPGLGDWVPCGQIKAPFGQALLVLDYSLKNKLREQVEQHEELHDGPGHDRKACAEFDRSFNYWASQAKVLARLFWEHARYEVPGLTVCGSIGVDATWQILMPTDTASDPFICDLGHQVRTTMLELVQILRLNPDENASSGGDSYFGKVEDGETVIATVTDPRIKGVWQLADKLKMALIRCQAKTLRSFADVLDELANNPGKSKELLQQLENGMAKTKEEGQVLERQERLLRDLAWALVRDTHVDPLDERGDSIAFRDGWKLVVCPEDNDGPGLEIVTVLEGVLSDPSGKGLSGLFGRRDGLLEKLRAAMSGAAPKE